MNIKIRTQRLTCYIIRISSAIRIQKIKRPKHKRGCGIFSHNERGNQRHKQHHRAVQRPLIFLPADQRFTSPPPMDGSSKHGQKQI
ncbi:MAG TPA: hypothetical protein VIU12_27670 [Chryseolinea sp.]